MTMRQQQKQLRIVFAATNRKVARSGRPSSHGREEKQRVAEHKANRGGRKHLTKPRSNHG